MKQFLERKRVEILTPEHTSSRKPPHMWSRVVSTVEHQNLSINFSPANDIWRVCIRRDWTNCNMHKKEDVEFQESSKAKRKGKTLTRYLPTHMSVRFSTHDAYMRSGRYLYSFWITRIFSSISLLHVPRSDIKKGFPCSLVSLGL